MDITVKQREKRIFVIHLQSSVLEHSHMTYHLETPLHQLVGASTSLRTPEGQFLTFHLCKILVWLFDKVLGIL